jgi:AraC-like DNA-binding protein
MPRNGPIPTRSPRPRKLPTLAQGLPRPVFARVESLAAGAWSAPHHHPWGQLSYAVQGVLQVHTAAGQFVAPPERAVWVPPHLTHGIHNVGQAELRSLYLQPDALPDSALARSTTCQVLEVSLLTRELILAVCALPVQYDIAGPAGRLVSVLLDQLAQSPVAALDLPLPTDARLLRLCDALQADPTDRRTLAAWGGLIGLSERAMSRLFQQQTGLSIGDWRRRLRLLRALGPLEAGVKVSAVALESGYSSASAFIAAFCTEFGVTPAQMFRAQAGATPPSPTAPAAPALFP